MIPHSHFSFNPFDILMGRSLKRAYLKGWIVQIGPSGWFHIPSANLILLIQFLADLSHPMNDDLSSQIKIRSLSPK